MIRQEFNEKYYPFLYKKNSGLWLDNTEAINYLDEVFEELIKLPRFKWKQIGKKFDYFYFYCDGISLAKREEVEEKLYEIYNH